MKKAKKLVAVLMAAVMVFSIGLMTASAADKTYEPQYTDTLPLETVEGLLRDGGLIISEKLLKGLIDPLFTKDDLIKTVYSLYPMIAGIGGGMLQLEGDPSTAAFYQKNFGALFDAMTAQPVTAETLAAYLANQNLGVTDQASFFKALKTALVPVLNIKLMMFGRAYSLVDMIVTPMIRENINTVISSFGWDAVTIQFSEKAVNADGEMLDPAVYASELCDSLARLLDYLHSDTLGKVMLAVRSLADEENRTKFTRGVSELAGGFTSNGILGGVLETEKNWPAPIYELLTVLMDGKNALKDPAIGNGKVAYDFTKLINRIMEIKLVGDLETPDAAQPIGLVLEEINWSNLKNLNEEHLDADTLMVVYHYLFNNLIADRANFEAIANLLSSIVPDIGSYLPIITGMEQDALLNFAAGLLNGMANPVVTLTHEATGVTVAASFPLGTEVSLTVAALTEGDAYAKLADALKEAASQFKAYDIALDQNGDPIPQAAATVSIPVPADFAADRVVVYALSEDGTVTAVEATIEEGVATFETNVPGVFAIAEKAVAEEPGSSTQTPGDTQPTEPTEPAGPTDTGDAFLSVMAAVAVLAGGALIVTKKHRS